MEWIKITDRLPDDEQVVDIWVDDWEFGGSRIADATWHYKEKIFDSEIGDIYELTGESFRATHWMNIPEPPK